MQDLLLGVEQLGKGANASQQPIIWELAYSPSAGEFLPVVLVGAGAVGNSDKLEELRNLVHLADLKEWNALATEFRDRVRAIDPDVQAWATYGADFVVTLVVDDHDMERELQFDVAFVQLAGTLSDPTKGELRVYAQSDDFDFEELGEPLG